MMHSAYNLYNLSVVPAERSRGYSRRRTCSSTVTTFGFNTCSLGNGCPVFSVCTSVVLTPELIDDPTCICIFAVHEHESAYAHSQYGRESESELQSAYVVVSGRDACLLQHVQIQRVTHPRC